MELTSFSGRWKLVLVLAYLALTAGVAGLGEATGWWAWDDGWVLPAVAAPYWLIVLGLDARRGRQSSGQGGTQDGRAGSAGSPVTADEVLNLQLTTTRLREAYDQDAVDRFLDRVIETLRSRAEGSAATDGPLTESDVLAVTFPSSRFVDGYDQDEVDDLLDRVAATLAGDTPAGGPAPGTAAPGATLADAVAAPGDRGTGPGTGTGTGTSGHRPAAATPAVVHEGSRGLRAWARERPGGPGDRRPRPSGRRWTVRGVLDALTYRVVLPALALFIVVLGVVDLPEALAAARGEGVPGTFVAQVEDCGGRGGCTWTGRFVPDDGSPAVEDVLLDDDVPDGAGSRLPVLYEGQVDPAVVYHADGDRAWLSIVLLLAGGLGYLGFCAWWLLDRAAVRRRRRAMA